MPLPEVFSNSQSRRRGLLRRRNRREIRYGIAAVEFAVIAPIFFLMVVGILEFGRALMVQQVIVSAARVGARQAVTLNATTAGVTTTVTNYADNAAVTGVSVAVNPSPNLAAAGEIITVTTTVNFDQVSWMPTPWFLGGKTLTSASSMRKEGLN
jgi:Flp pilus assembly protein TadG